MKRGGFDGLAALVADCATAGVARQALLVRVDRLPIRLTRPHHVRLAEAALAPLLRLPRAELFHLPGPSLAVVWRGEADAALLDVIQALEHLLADPGSATPVLSNLIALYDLPNTGDLLLEAFTRELQGKAEPQAVRNATLSLEPQILAMLEGCLAQADVARFVRRQPVWRHGGPQPLLAWEERFLSIDELTDQLAPGHDLRAEPWLFRRLTRTLDRRMLALLASPGELAMAGAFSVSLNTTSLLGPDFIRFDAALPKPLRGRVVISLTPTDLLTDAQSLRFAVDFARARGYSFLLQTDTADVLPTLSPILHSFDYLAVPWHAAQLDAAKPQIEQMAEHIVLTGADTHEAITWGAANGVRLFAGALAHANAPIATPVTAPVTSPATTLARGSARDPATASAIASLMASPTALV